MDDAHARARAERRQTGLRLALFYGAVFAAFGIQLPYWPVWLEAERGLAPEAIGILLAALIWPRVVAGPALGRLSDRIGERRRLMVLLAACTLAGFALFPVVHGFGPLFVLSLVVGTAFAGILPLGEASALEAARSARVDYPRARLAGSLTFILAATGGGFLIEAGSPQAILPLLLGTLLVTTVACWLMPSGRPRAPRAHQAALGELMRRRGLWPALLAAALIQTSHAVYYGFATIHWRAAGHGGDAIGWLWAEGVIAEVVLFAFATRLVGGAGPARLLVIAGLLGAVRWSVTAVSVDLVTLFAVQTLHAATFGLTHLATMRHLEERAPDQLASAQGLYASLQALLLGLATPLAGWLYGQFSGGSFLAMAVLALAAALVPIAQGMGVSRRPDGGRSGISAPVVPGPGSAGRDVRRRARPAPDEP